MNSRLIIGITAGHRKIPSIMGKSQNAITLPSAFHELFQSYENIIPIILYPHQNENVSQNIIPMLDGLVLSSGENIDPSTYNVENKIQYSKHENGLGKKFNRPLCFLPNIMRDKFEIELYHKAKQKQIPILGVCRGLQLINVAEGGTLHQEMPEGKISHFLGEDGWVHYHDILLEKGSKIESIVNKDLLTMPSIHMQSIDKIGKDLDITGKCPDGTPEIIEHKNKSQFIIGIQGHFEKAVNNYSIYEKLTESFIQHAEESKAVPV